MHGGRRWLTMITLGLLLGVSSYGVVGTGAWFTSQDEILGNTIEAGTLDVQVSGGPFHVENLAPGGDWDGPYIFEIRNQGTLPALYDISVDGITQTVSGFKNKVNVRLLNGFVTSAASCTGTYLIDQDTLPDVAGTSSDNPWGNAYLAPNGSWTDVWWVCFQLDGSAGNQYQDAEATFDIVVDGYQPEAP